MPVSTLQRAKRALVSLLLSLAAAYGVDLKLAREACDDDVMKAFRRVSRRVPPDKGGVAADAQRLNAARDAWAAASKTSKGRGRPAKAAQAAPAAAAAAAGLAPVCEGFRVRSVAALLTTRAGSPYSPTRAGSSQTVPQRGSGFCSSRKAMLHPGVCSTGLLPWSRTVQGHATCNSCCSSRLPWTVGRAALPLMASGSTRARTTTSGKDGAATCCSSPSTGACFNVWAEKLLSSCYREP